MRSKTTLLLLAMLVSASPVGAAPRHAVSLHFLHPWSTSPDPDTESAVRLSLLYGRSRAVTALDLGGAASVTSGDVRYAQGTFGFAGVGGDLHGFALTGGVHLVHGDATGVQFSGLVSWTKGELHGFQYGNLLSRAGGGLRGVQLAGVVNQSDGPARWVQLGTVANIAVGEFHGFQAAGIANHVHDRMAGVQLGVLNYTHVMRGVQVGVLNLGRDVSGLQVGVINRASHEFSGVPLGLLSVGPEVETTGVVYASNHAAATAGLRTVVDGWSSIIGVGYGDAIGAVSNAGFFGWHFGRRVLDRGPWRATIDVGFTHVVGETSDDPAAPGGNYPAVQLRLHGERRLGRAVALLAGVGASSVADSYDEDAETEGELLVFGGLVLGGWR